MFENRIGLRGASAATAIILALVSGASWAQGEQVLAEGRIVGPVIDNNNGQQGVFGPEFESGLTDPDYTTIVTPALGRDFKDVAISAKGSTIVLDGNMLREYSAAGEQINAVDCSDITFTAFKKNGTPIPNQTLASCSAFTVLLDGTLRIAGQSSNGGGFDIIAYDPESGQAALKAAGTPPEISAVVGDIAEQTEVGAVYFWVGERKKIGKSQYNMELDPNAGNTLESFEIIATLNGLRIDDVSLLDANRLIVVTDNGELYQVNATTGNAQQFATLPDGSACGLDRKDPQRYSLSSLSGQVFVSNRGCNTITIYDDQNPPQEVQNLTNYPLELVSPDTLYPERMEVIVGLGGDYGDCDGASEADGCQYSLEAGGAVMWSVQTVDQFPTTYRMFEFKVADCRWTGGDCPIVNCLDRWPAWDPDLGAVNCAAPNAVDQVLDLVPLWIKADESGLFEFLAFGDGPHEQALVPAYLRGEKVAPAPSNPGLPPVDCDAALPGECVDVGYEIISLVAATDALFTGTFFVDYKLDLLRGGTTLDPCVIPPAPSSVGAINETFGTILYNSTNGFGTVNRPVEGTRGGIIVNDECNGRGSVARWSANSVSLELYDLEPDAYVVQAHRMAGELQQVKDELVCTEFPNPDYPGSEPRFLGPLLDPLGVDCADIQNELDQVKQKLDVCFTSLFSAQQGNSAENCNALFTKLNNLEAELDDSAWPNPLNPANFEMLRPNYEGEFRSRISSLGFFIESYVIPSVPPGGIPGTPPPALP
jgi:hypothetical protein